MSLRACLEGNEFDILIYQNRNRKKKVKGFTEVICPHFDTDVLLVTSWDTCRTSMQQLTTGI